jgi:hypothetical protein
MHLTSWRFQPPAPRTLQKSMSFEEDCPISLSPSEISELKIPVASFFSQVFEKLSAW